MIVRCVAKSALGEGGGGTFMEIKAIFVHGSEKHTYTNVLSSTLALPHTHLFFSLFCSLSKTVLSLFFFTFFLFPFLR